MAIQPWGQGASSQESAASWIRSCVSLVSVWAGTAEVSDSKAGLPVRGSEGYVGQ